MKCVCSRATGCAVALLLALLGQGCGSAPEYAKRTVTPEDAERANELLLSGSDSLAAGRLDAACSSLAQSYELRPDPAPLLYLGICYFRRNDLQQALETFDRTLALAAMEPDPIRRSSIESNAKNQRASVVERMANASHQEAAATSSALPSTAPSERGPRWPNLSASPRRDGDGKKDAAVIVAIEQYAFLPSIPGAFDNGRDWYQYLTRARGIPVERVRFLSNAEATDFAIMRAVAEASDAAQAGGRVWLVFIGHGAPSASGDGLLVAADAQQSIDGLENRSVPQSKLLSRMAKSTATPIAIVDACFSGRKQDGDVLIAGLQPSSVVKASAPQRSVLLTAAASNQFAGPLPGESRPAFSYLALGALRGWGDTNGDGDVTAQEVVDYSRSVFMTLLAGSRIQTPEVLGQSALLLGRGSEQGPDLGDILLDLKSSGARPATSLEPARGEADLPQFDQDLAARKLNEAAKQAENCRPADGPHGSGRVRVQYDASGAVSSVQILTAKFQGTTTGACIQLVFRRAAVTPFRGHDVTVFKNFEIPE